MASFATPTDMEQRSQGAITAATHPFLQKELDAATRAIQDECRWHIAPQESKTFRRTGPYEDQVWLPAMEITAITAANLDNEVVTDLPSIEFDRDTGWTNLSGRIITVTFTSGFATVPEDIVTLTLQVAARALGSPLGLVREQAGTVSVTHSQPGFNVAGGTVLLTHEKDQLAAYRLGRLP